MALGIRSVHVLVVVILGAVGFAAVVLPGLLTSGRASNDRSSEALLKILSCAEYDFRSNDRDWNHVNDFWVADVSGLYRIFANGETIKLIEMAVAVADAWQHHGIGLALLSAALEWARLHGFRRVHGTIRWSNPAILGLVRACGRTVRIVTTAEGDTEAVIDVVGDLPAAA